MRREYGSHKMHHHICLSFDVTLIPLLMRNWLEIPSCMHLAVSILVGGLEAIVLAHDM